MLMLYVHPISVFDEAVEMVDRQQAAGQRTRDLFECATASLDSPCTALWSQVLNEVTFWRVYGGGGRWVRPLIMG